MTTSKKITVSQEHAGQRLDIFLLEKLKLSRSQAQKLIKNNQILINNSAPKKARNIVNAKDIINILAEKITEVLGKEKRGSNTKQKKFTFKISTIAKKADYLVIDKPTGMLTHSTEKNESDSLAAILLKKYPELKGVGEDPLRPGIVHRLDKDASGLLVVARNQTMFENLKTQFKEHTINKEYIVLVHGQVSKDWDEINFPIKRSTGEKRMAAIPLSAQSRHADAKSALTEFLVEKRYINFTLLRVTIHTGRMHQIRAHMLAYNHPVVGDPLYFQNKRKDRWDKECGRLFLHCTKLVFKDLNGVSQEFSSPLPENLEQFLTKLK